MMLRVRDLRAEATCWRSPIGRRFAIRTMASSADLPRDFFSICE